MSLSETMSEAMGREYTDHELLKECEELSRTTWTGRREKRELIQDAVVTRQKQPYEEVHLPSTRNQ